MSAKIGIRELKKQLSQYEKEDLIKLIADLYKSNAAVQNQLSVRFDDTAIEELAEQYKKKIQQAIYGRTTDLRGARKQVSEFKKLAPNDFAVIDMMLYYVLTCVNLSYEYGDMWEAFYDSLIKMFADAAALMNKQADQEGLKKFEPVIDEILQKSSVFGYGAWDELDDMCHNVDFLANRYDTEQ